MVINISVIIKIACPSNCNNCTYNPTVKKTQCTNCTYRYSLQPNFTCSLNSTCPSGQYFNTPTLKCLNCSANCTNCTANLTTGINYKCYSCANQMVLDSVGVLKY